MHNNKFLIYHDFRHAGVRLECNSCYKGEAVSKTFGFYPGGYEAHDIVEIDNNDNILNRLTKILFTTHIAGLSVIKNQFGYYRSSTTGSLTISTKLAKFTSKLYYNHIDLNSECKIMEEDYSYLETKNFPYINFEISDEVAETIYLKIELIKEKCNHQEMSYHIWYYNCVSFAQDLYEIIEPNVTHYEKLYDSKYPWTLLGILGKLKYISSLFDNLIEY